MAKSEFPIRGRGRPRKDQPVGPTERQEIAERRTSQFDELLAGQRERQVAVSSKPARVKRETGPLIYQEPDNPERAGLAREPEQSPRETAKGGRGRKALKRKRTKCGRLKRRNLPEPLAEFVNEMVEAPGRVAAAVQRKAARVKPPKGWTRLEQLLGVMARAWDDPAVWVTPKEIEVAAKAAGLPRDDVNWLLRSGRKKGWLEMREVRDPVREQVVPAPGGVVPRRLWRLSRAGKAWVALLG